MLKIRLRRIGKKHDPSFRVVLTDSRKGPQSGAFLEILGNYNAQKGEPQLKGERIKHWISKGAQISDTVHNLLLKLKIIEGKKKDVLHHERIKKAGKEKAGKEKPAEEEKPEAPKSEEIKPESAGAENLSDKEEKPAEETKNESNASPEEKTENKEEKTIEEKPENIDKQ
ncbi:MAG TPA: 30S ribosomal protein S16 [Candidatus Campbellbacteria bacterium]|nr:30S ribosomal protein S16 [Candidatus Campbellbacteria bacterium]